MELKKKIVGKNKIIIFPIVGVCLPLCITLPVAYKL